MTSGPVPAGNQSTQASKQPEAKSQARSGVVAQAGGGMTLLALQAAIGNQAVQRLAAKGVIQREGDGVLYLDGSGVAHKEPDPSTAPNIIHMDERGVGHEHPSKLPGVLFMDEAGVGHDKADESETPEVMYMDDSGVGHEKPDEVDADVAKVKTIVAKHHGDSAKWAEEITTNMKAWPESVAAAEAAKGEAEAAFTSGSSNWNIEHAEAGLYSAQWAEQADEKAIAAQTEHDETVPEHTKAKAAYSKLLAWQKGFKANYARFRKDRPNWLKSGSPMTVAAVNEITQLLRGEAKTSKTALAEGATADVELGKMKTAWDEAASFADKAWGALKSPTTAGYVIVGHLQQKLNATRPDGTDRLTVHALFDGTTDTQLRAFQGTNGLAVTGKADSDTWTALNTQAPSIMQNGKLTVASKEGAQSAVPLNDAIHPEVSFGDSGMQVTEIQQRLNNWVSAQPEADRPFKMLTCDGSFGFRDRWALQAFQKAVGLPDTGWANKETWAELDKISGAITGGTRQFDWTESVEGISNVGTTANFDWQVKDGTLTITVKIKFTGASSHPMVATWLTDIREVWNNYKAVEQGPPVPRAFNVNFNPVQSSSGFHKVNVGQPTTANPNPRSDSANWYVNDNRRGLAPHEFGHLIGLVDEYNRPEEQGIAASGLEPTVGRVASTSGSTSTTVADEINAILVGNVDKTSDQRLGLVVAKLQAHGVVQGAFARLVELRYKTKYGFDGEANLAACFAKHNSKKWTSNLTAATQPFLMSNASLMGTMTSNMGRDQDMTALAPHDHPVQPRHIRDFANLMTLAIPGTAWKPERR